MGLKAENMSNWLLKIPEWLLFIGVSVLVSEEFLRSTLDISFLTSDAKDLRISIGIAVITLFVISMRIELGKLSASFARSTNKLLGVLEVLHAHENIDFRDMLETCSEIKILSLSGTKAASLGDGRVQELLSDPERKSKITILLANPHSNAIETRYENDEPESFEAGTEGINRRLIWLYRIISQLSIAAKKKIDVRVYDNYPVVSIVQADNDIYSTSYGFKLRGGDCPKVHSLRDGEYGVFLLKHFGKVYEEAIPLEEWHKKYIMSESQYEKE